MAAHIGSIINNVGSSYILDVNNPKIFDSGVIINTITPSSPDTTQDTVLIDTDGTLKFDGTNVIKGFSYKNIVNIGTVRNLSVSVWVKITEFNDTDKVIVKAGGTVNGWAIYNKGDKVYAGCHSESSEFQGAWAESTIELNKWVNVVYVLEAPADNTIDSSYGRFYINGNFISNVNASRIQNYTASFSIGKADDDWKSHTGDKSANPGMKGNIGYLSVQLNSLSDNDVKSNYISTRNRFK